MNPSRSAVFFAAFLFLQSAYAQKELTPEPGSLAELDRYDLKLREAFSAAYEKGVDLRAILLPSFSPEIALFVDEKSNIITLSPKETTIWSHEHRELVHRGSIKRFDVDGREIRPDEKDDAERRIPEKISDIKIEMRSRPIPQALLQAVREVWEDALMHATHTQEPHSGLDGASWHYSLWIRGRGVLSGTVWSPDGDTIPSALNALSTTLIDYASKEANESHISSALWNYKVATKVRGKGMAQISIQKPVKVIPIAISVDIARSTILPEFSADNVRIELALQRLTAESTKWGKVIGYEGISFSAEKDLAQIKVTYSFQGESMKSICEALADQIGAELEFNKSEVVFLKKSE